MGKLTIEKLKREARQLRASLEQRGMELGHGMCLEAMSAAYEFQS